MLSALTAMSYSDAHARSHCRVLDIGDLALHCCEYACVLKELLDSEQRSGSLLDWCHWLLQRMPPHLPNMRLLRKRAVAHCRQSPDFATGWDDAGARNVLQWWLSNSALEVTPECSWPAEICSTFYSVESWSDPYVAIPGLSRS